MQLNEKIFIFVIVQMLLIRINIKELRCIVINVLYYIDISKY